MKASMTKAERRQQRKIQKQLAERYGNQQPVPADEIVDWMEYQFRGRCGYRYLTIGKPDSLISSVDERNSLSVVWLHDELPQLREDRYESRRQLPVICLVLDRERDPQQGLVYDHYQHRYAVGTDLTQWYELTELKAGRSPAFNILPAPLTLLQNSAESSLRELSGKMDSLKKEMTGILREMIMEPADDLQQLSEMLQQQMATADQGVNQFVKLLIKNEQFSKKNLQELEQLIGELPEFVSVKSEEVTSVTSMNGSEDGIEDNNKEVLEGTFTTVDA